MRQLTIGIFLIVLVPMAFSNCVLKFSTQYRETNTSSELTELNQSSIPLINETEDFVNTDNPYSSLPPNAFEEAIRKYSFLQEETNYVNTSIIPERLKRLAELDDEEGSRPIYVLVFFDDEEEALGSTNMLEFLVDFEKADETMLKRFDIDFRLLGILSWESNDTEKDMYKLRKELEETYSSIYLGRPFQGNGSRCNYWNATVDIVLGITNQETEKNQKEGEILGIAPFDYWKDQGRNTILLNLLPPPWTDNMIQHEIGHMFYLTDHYNKECCIMENHEHYIVGVIEDGAVYPVFANIKCLFTAYDFCPDCSAIITAYRDLYSTESNYSILVRNCDFDYSDVVTLDYAINPPLFFTSNVPFSVELKVISVKSGYTFLYFLINGKERLNVSTATIVASDQMRHIKVAVFYRQEYKHVPPSFPVPDPWNGRGGSSDSRKFDVR